jgi:hypothetical protein
MCNNNFDNKNNTQNNMYINDDYKYYKLKPLIVNPIKEIKYDDIFFNIRNISHAFLSSNYDRVVIFYNNTKGVYYFERETDLERIDYILKQNNVNMKIIKDYKREMDSYDGVLYCSPRNNTDIQLKESIIEDYNNYKEDNTVIYNKLNNIYKYFVDANKNDSSYNIDNKINNIINKVKPILVEQIKEIEFDDILYNLKNISHVYLSGNYDRVVVLFNDTKGVYYFRKNRDLDRIEYMLKLSNLKIQIIKDYVRVMDTYNGILYCTPKNKTDEKYSEFDELYNSDYDKEYNDNSENEENSESDFYIDEEYDISKYIDNDNILIININYLDNNNITDDINNEDIREITYNREHELENNHHKLFDNVDFFKVINDLENIYNMKNISNNTKHYLI